VDPCLDRVAVVSNEPFSSYIPTSLQRAGMRTRYYSCDFCECATECNTGNWACLGTAAQPGVEAVPHKKHQMRQTRKPPPRMRIVASDALVITSM
jgi:hypothetical protein